VKLGFTVPDAEARDRWAPFADTRPLSELLFGTLTLGERAARATGLEVEASPGSEDPSDPDAPPAPGAGARLLLDPTFVPAQALDPLRLEALARDHGGPLRLVAHGAPAGWVLPEGGPPPADAPPGAPVELSGRLLASPWNLMEANAAQVVRDLADALPAGASPLDPLPPGVHQLGDHPVTVGAGVQVDPGVVLDTRAGPIHLGAGVDVRAFTRLEGPAWIGADTRLLGGVFSALSTGPVCRLRGEIEASVINGWCNKAHDGYLGHAVLGRWVNLGALTTNSDLKNTYGSVRVPLGPTRTRDSGMLKVGVLLGDHVKTGIGTLLNTGTVVGAGSTLFAGGGFPPRWVPPFSWGSGAGLEPARLEAMLEVAERAMARRDRALAAHERRALEFLWHRAHGAESAS
jgi:UDP-N-acetylglucosamine diphosphorylase / glucose-1-phosphate thymidylyltransferase / UDP-N-acetylgalactosamine diphosphorylase / glucosamine-1-phosphate N-acetyltransferase / galactosamine-1-phosphate N-acetyltransferase